MNRKTLHWWSKLDDILRMAASYDDLHQILLEDERIADAHSHPGRTTNGETTKAIRRAWELIEAQADMDHD